MIVTVEMVANGQTWDLFGVHSGGIFERYPDEWEVGC